MEEVTYEQETFPVIEKGKFVGVLDLGAVERVPRHLWKKVNTFQASLPTKSVRFVDPDSDAFSVLITMSIKTKPIAFVVQKGKILGVVDSAVLSNYLRIKMDLSKTPK